jgi:long-chain acyl-CoA synthetase
MNLAQAFLASAQQHAGQPAIFWGERQFTHAEVSAAARRLGRYWQTRFHVQPGDRVGLWLKNCPEFVMAVFGILNAGAVVVPINNFLKPAEVGYILNDAEIDLLITDAELGTQEQALRESRAGLKLFRVEELGGLPHADAGEAVVPARRATDLAVLIYTSGTTGHPKGAMLSHANLLHNVESCRLVLEAVDEDRFVVILPLFHTYMLCVGLMLPMLTGGGMVLVKSLHPMKNLLREIATNHGTILPAIPQFYRSLVHAAVPAELPLRICLSGAAPLPLQVLEEFEARFGVPLIEGYGLSEASPVVSKNPLRGTRKAGSVGLPVPNVEVSIQDDAGQMLGPGETGEVCVRGGNVMMGYWNNPEQSVAVLRKGWLLTGDMGHLDSEGYLYITDRKKDMLLVNGSNVYPRELEEILYQVPGIKEAAVVGVPDPRKGEQPVAFVSALEGITLDPKAIQQMLRAKLADYKVPKRIEVLPALPRNATGKILKTRLRILAHLARSSAPEE